MFTSLPPLSLYIHFPWCVRKCPYCDFNSHEARHGVPENNYVNALLRDLEHDIPLVGNRHVETIFIGGGTPSLLSPEAIDSLLTGVRARVNVDSNAEVTLEANPGTVDYQRFAGFRGAGINRLSLGIQSFCDDKLQALGRIHSAQEAMSAIDAVHRAGFDNFNLDLMFGLPGQSVQEACGDIRNAIAAAPTHVSAYQLTLEPGTPFYHRPPRLPDDDATWAMQLELEALLAEAGFAQYEVSAYARPGFACRHNLNYWRFGDYVGIGAGAHGKITHSRGISRMWKRKQPDEYLAHAGSDEAIAGEQRVSERDIPLEFMMNALRLLDGCETELFTQRTGLPLAVVDEALAAAIRRGLVEQTATHIRPTPLGLRFLNDLLGLFVPLAATACSPA